MLTKEGNTVTITIRPSKYHPYESPQFTLKKESTSTEKNDVPCIEMGNGNNLVITGKGTLNITRNESKSRGAALYSDVGDITINGGITVNVSFLNGKDYNNKNVSSNAIYVGDNHNLTVSGSGTNVTATNQGFDSSPATVCVEGGTITVSGGASLSATNTYDDNRSGSDDVKIQHFNSYAISGTKSNPCTLIVADEKSSVTATTNDFTNIAESWAFKYTTIQAAGATIKAGSSASNSTVTTIDNISGQRYAKISVPALQKPLMSSSLAKTPLSAWKPQSHPPTAPAPISTIRRLKPSPSRMSTSLAVVLSMASSLQKTEPIPSIW